MSDTDIPCCSECVYFRSDMYNHYTCTGECRRHAPAALDLDSVNAKNDFVPARWPCVGSDDWCGDFERIDQKEREQRIADEKECDAFWTELQRKKAGKSEK